MFLANQRFIFHDFLLCRPSQRSAPSQVPSQVATHQEIGSQLWAGETLDSNPGLQDNSLVRSAYFIYVQIKDAFLYWCLKEYKVAENVPT